MDQTTRDELVFNLARLRQKGLTQLSEQERQRIGNNLSEMEQFFRSMPVCEQSVDFSDVTYDDLRNLGVEAKRLKLLEAQAENRFGERSSKAKISRFCDDLKMTCDHAVYTAPSLIISEFLFATASLVPIKADHHIRKCIEKDVDLPDTRLRNPKADFELLVSGALDYLLLQYEESDSDWKSRPILPPNPLITQCFNVVPDSGQAFFIQQIFPALKEPHDFPKFIPGVVARAMAVAQWQDLPELHFCLTDGQIWCFFVLKQVDDKWTYYKSEEYDIGEPYNDYFIRSASLEGFKRCACQILYAFNILSMYLPLEGLYELV